MVTLYPFEWYRMIKHLVLDDEYKSLSQEWTIFLKPFENQIDSVSIHYQKPCPLFIDTENRKFKIDFENDRNHYAKYKSGRSSEPLSRALGGGKYGSRVLDLSAGLGVDAVFLAQLGYQVTAIERNPLIYLALQKAWNDLTANYKGQLKFIFDEAQNFLKKDSTLFDLCYFDPMFPTKNKTALPKQEMLFFKNLVGEDRDAGDVMALALQSRRFKRCVVKRPLSAEPLLSENFKPTGNIKGKIIRYDIYTH